MLVGYGWCVLRTSREPYRTATAESVDRIDDAVEAADEALWSAFRTWMSQHVDEPIQWHLHERVNNHCGVLLFCVSRNHRASAVWDMLRWIADQGPGSYGLCYVHDDEDQPANRNVAPERGDYHNMFRVHRIANGEISEWADPFLSPIVPTLNPNDMA